MCLGESFCLDKLYRKSNVMVFDSMTRFRSTNAHAIHTVNSTSLCLNQCLSFSTLPLPSLSLSLKIKAH